MGTPVLELAALFVLEGRQVIIRGDIPELVSATVKTLKVKVGKTIILKCLRIFSFDATVKYQELKFQKDGKNLVISYANIWKFLKWL